MKLKLPVFYGQRDSRWASEMLGYNLAQPYTIGNYGCLITSFGNYIGKTPSEVNETLKNNQGFQSGGNFVWSKCTVLGLTQTYQSPYYSDPVTPQGLSKMRSLLDEGKPLITHIDFDPRDADDDMHWLLVYGYDENDVFYAQDPWTGTQITLDVYGGAKKCVYEWRAYDKVLPKDTGVDEMTQCRKDRDENHQDRMALYEELGFTGLFNRVVSVEKIKMLMSMEQQVKLKDEQLKEAQDKIKVLQDEALIKEEELKKIQDDMTKLNGRITTAIEQNKILQGKLEKAQTNVQKPVFTGWKKRLYDFLLK